MSETWDGTDRRAGTDRRKAQIPERVIGAFDAATETRLNNLSQSETAAIQKYLALHTELDDRSELLKSALKDLFPVPLGRDATRTSFTPYFLLIRNGPDAKIGYVYACQQGREGGQVDKIFNWKGSFESSRRKFQVLETVKPAKMYEAGSKWVPIEKGVVD